MQVVTTVLTRVRLIRDQYTILVVARDARNGLISLITIVETPTVSETNPGAGRETVKRIVILIFVVSRESLCYV